MSDNIKFQRNHVSYLEPEWTWKIEDYRKQLDLHDSCVAVVRIKCHPQGSQSDDMKTESEWVTSGPVKAKLCLRCDHKQLHCSRSCVGACRCKYSRCRCQDAEQ